METGTLIAILGVATTVIIGAPTILYLRSRHRYPGQLTLIKESSVGLFDSIVKNLPELQVLFEGEPASPGLVLWKGYLLNTGSKDITESMINEPVSISLPPNHKWLTAKVVSSSPKVDAQLHVEPSLLTVSTGLVRREEYISFEAVLEIPLRTDGDKSKSTTRSDRAEKAFTIDHRIADTRRVRLVELPELKRPRRRLKIMLVLIVISFLFGSAIAYKELFGFGSTGEMRYLMPLSSGDTIEVRITPKKDDQSVIVKGVYSTFEKRMPSKAFYSTKGLQPKIVDAGGGGFPVWIIVVSIYSGFPLILAAVLYRGYRRSRALCRILQPDTSTQCPPGET